VPQVRQDRPDHSGEPLGLPLGEPHLALFDARADRRLGHPHEPVAFVLVELDLNQTLIAARAATVRVPSGS
jgi:hypothetical protein